VPRSWLNASLLAQRLVAGSIFLNKKKGKNNAKKLSQLHALEPARCAVIIPGQYIFMLYSFLSFHIRSPAQRDVAGSLFWSLCFFFVFFVQKN